jgi:hypothetical protein
MRWQSAWTSSKPGPATNPSAGPAGPRSSQGEGPSLGRRAQSRNDHDIRKGLVWHTPHRGTRRVQINQLS